MRIIDIKATWISIPTEKPLLISHGVHPGRFTRTIVEIITDEGIVGLGEVNGGDNRGALEALRSRLVGEDPFNLERIRQKILRTVYFLSNPRVYAGVEMACLDIQGKAVGRPVCDILGGKVRDSVQMSGYLFYRYGKDVSGDELEPAAVAAEAERLVAKHGFKCLKLKGGVFDPALETATCFELRRRFGDKMLLRYDPQGIWSLATALRYTAQLEEIDLEYLEDPALSIEAMAAVRSRTKTPLATNMCVHSWNELAPGIRAGAVDVVLGDLHYWEGCRGVKGLAAVCEAFGLSLSLHSGTEFGITMAAMLHTAASTPYMSHAIDAHYHHLTDDVIVGGKLEYIDGFMKVPTGPGLGVELDRDKLEKYARFAEEQGDYYRLGPTDNRRPNFVPTHPRY